MEIKDFTEIRGVCVYVCACACEGKHQQNNQLNVQNKIWILSVKKKKNHTKLQRVKKC